MPGLHGRTLSSASTPGAAAVIGCAVLSLAHDAGANAPPEVENVSASQRQDASGRVDIEYDLTDADGDACTVTVFASDDGGATWTVPIASLTGDVGVAVAPGSGRSIVWNPAVDIPGASGDAFHVRICADDGYEPPPPAGMVLIPGGVFTMGRHVGSGSPEELPLHDVLIDPMFMSINETTSAAYCAYLNAAHGQGLIEITDGVVHKAGGGEPYCGTSSSSGYSRIHWDGVAFTVEPGKEDHPMLLVTWCGAAAYANWRSAHEGLQPCYDLVAWTCDWDADGCRLPTEAEWEYAARGGAHDPYRMYPWGDDLDGSKANYWQSGDPYENTYPWTTPVGYYDGDQSPPGADMANGYGLYDMAGNVYEWCHDWYDGDYYDTSPFDNPHGPGGGTLRVLRGGSWHYYDGDLHCARRGRREPDTLTNRNGFRLARAAGAGRRAGARLGIDCAASGDFTISAAAPCPWDTAPGSGGDGTVGLGDLNALLSNWGACPPPPDACPWDFAPEPDGDGTVGLGDLNALLSNWGPCPE
jgi:sulfatase modifying factor 1